MNLDPDAQRPIVHLTEFHNLDALFDTGSLFPIWCASEKRLQVIGGKKVSNYAPFSGFGGVTVGNLYDLELFQMGKLIFPHLKIIACEYPSMVAPLILSATMFDNLCYEINDETHLLNITISDNQSCIRNLTIKNKQGRLFVLCTSAEIDNTEKYIDN